MKSVELSLPKIIRAIKAAKKSKKDSALIGTYHDSMGPIWIFADERSRDKYNDYVSRFDSIGSFEFNDEKVVWGR